MLAKGALTGVNDTLTLGPVNDARFGVIREVRSASDISYLGSRFADVEDWRRRVEQLRQTILTGAGLLPMPDRCPLNARVFGLADRGDYTVEKVYFESHPGFFVTGNLYRPKRPSTGSGRVRFPAVLSPHGHWSRGRLNNDDLCSVPGRCINFAKQGYVAFSYDMIGYNDSRQLDHKFGGPREKLWGISLGGLQLWNSMRAVDFLQSLPYVDKGRIACTGASGGGTQTFLLCAVDHRVKVCSPVNMISASFHGGCLCENPPIVRVDTNNVEIGAMMAPRPMLMVSASGDWTKDTPGLEFPAVRRIYALFGAEEKVSNHHQDAGHNYNLNTREAVYSWFGRWLASKPLPQPVKEQPFEVEKDEHLLVFPDGKLPQDAAGQDSLVQELIEASKAQSGMHKPVDAAALRSLRKTYLPPLRSALSLWQKPVVEAESRGELRVGDCVVTALTVQDKTRGAAVPAVLFVPAKGKSRRAALLVHDNGKSALLNPAADGPGPLVGELLKRKMSVLLIDCFGVGEHTAPEGSPARDADTDLFDTYNRTDCAERVYDVAVAETYLSRVLGYKRIAVAGFGRAGLWCMLARPFGPKVDALVADADGFDNSTDESFIGEMYVPCLRRAGDLSTALAVCAPDRTFIHNTKGRFDTGLAKSAYDALGCGSAFAGSAGRADGSEIADRLAAGVAERQP